MSALIELNAVSKSYPKIHSSKQRFAAFKTALFNRPYTDTHNVLSDIDLRVDAGQSLGLIGENGAGKSTMLKLVAGVLHPTSGRIQRRGKIAALLELGAGFHPEYSGLDNIRMNAALLGLSPADLANKREEIIAFADIGDYIHEPIKHYSSGMVVRLGFAMMTAMQPDLLITDEVLAVGDESFQKKCIVWMENYLANGGTLLLCSHGMYHVQKLCQRAIWVENGRIRREGDVFEITKAYLNYHERKSAQQQTPEVPSQNQHAAYAVREMRLTDAQGNDIDALDYRGALYVRGVVYSPDNRTPVVAIGIDRLDGLPIYGCSSWMDGAALTKIDEQMFGFCLRYPDLPILPGEYIVKSHAMDPEAMRLFDTVEMTLNIVGKTFELGSCRLEHEWVHDNE